jgi:hypothetical protein
MPTRKVKARSTKKKQTHNGKAAPRNQRRKTARHNKETADSEPSESEQSEHEDCQPRKKPRRMPESDVEEVGDDSDEEISSEAAPKEDNMEVSEVRSVQKGGTR